MSTLQISKTIPATAQQLFNAWTDGDQLKQWWKPMNNQLKQVINEVREGGKIQYEFEGGLLINGQYEKVAQGKLLVYSWNWDFSISPVSETHFRLQIEFAEKDNEATVSITQEGFDKEEHITPHKQGWNEGLEQLADFVTQQNGNTQTNNGEEKDEVATGKPTISGYNETPEQQKVAGG